MQSHANFDRPRAEQIQLAAMFFEGEGCICISVVRKSLARQGRQPYYRLELSISQVNPLPLLFFQHVFGGSVDFSGQGRVHHKRGMWRWIASAPTKIKPILEEMYPYLMGKQVEAAIGLEFLNLQANKMRSTRPLTEQQLAEREQLRLRLKALRSNTYLPKD